MELITAAKAGFCFGVKRAVDMVYEQCEKPNVYTFGPIIHNEEVVKDLEKKGVIVLNDVNDLEKIPKGIVIIRAHGILQEIYDKIRAAGHEIVDATCPFVLKIHKIVKEAYAKGEYIVIIGDCMHPEVQAIKSCAKGSCTVIGSEAEAEEFLKNQGKQHQNLCLVSQTTFNYNKFQDLVEIFCKNSYYRVNVLNTICNATEERQSEARRIAAEVEAMIVIGGKNSSNTQKLFEICREACPNTFFIQTAQDLDYDVISGFDKVGITAGASTPDNIIEEVQKQCQKKVLNSY